MDAVTVRLGVQVADPVAVWLGVGGIEGVCVPVVNGVLFGVGAAVCERVAVPVKGPVTVLEKEGVPEGEPVWVPVAEFVEDPVTVRVRVGRAEADRDELKEMLEVGVEKALPVLERVLVTEAEAVPVPDPV